MFYVRLLGLTLLRYLSLLVLVLFVKNFEVSPLPEWTLVLFAYLMHTVITAAFAYWAFRHRLVTMPRIVAVCVSFILLGTMLEAWLYLLLIQGDARDLWANYSWRSLPLLILYVGAILLAVVLRRRQQKRGMIKPVVSSVAR